MSAIATDYSDRVLSERTLAVVLAGGCGTRLGGLTAQCAKPALQFGGKYKCIDFPLQWKLEKVLFKNIEAQDSTILYYNNTYWLFTNVVNYKGTPTTGHELFLFYAENLLDDHWTEHPQNPIIVNHSFSRPAGQIYSENDKLFRPVQNCSKHYGYGMYIMQIDVLNKKEYKEHQVKSIVPDWDKDLISTHTLNHHRHLTVIDAKIKRKK